MSRSYKDRDLDEQRSTYRDLQSYIEDNLFDAERRKNPTMKLVSLDSVPPIGLDGKMEIVLTGANQIQEALSFMERLQQFRPGTKVTTTKGESTGEVRYVIKTPWKTQRSGGKDSAAEEEQEDVLDSGPSPLRFAFWTSAGIVLCIVSWRTTAWSDWVVLAKTFGLQ
jgi:hypothetical protein